MTVETRVYETAKSAVFYRVRERHGDLSNMASGLPIHVNGTRWGSSEALYQALRFPQHPDTQEAVLAAPNPMTSKIVSRGHLEKSRPDWPAVNVAIMKQVLRMRFGCNQARLREAFVQTGDAPIVEMSLKDDFWGAKPSVDGLLVGRNVLGRLMMGLRPEFLAHPVGTPFEVPDSRVPGNILLGEWLGQMVMHDQSDEQVEPRLCL